LAAYQRGLFAESAEYNRRAAEIDPGSLQAHFNRAAALFRAGDFPGALESLMNALKLAPGDPQILKQIDFVKSRAAADGKR
jgi:Flp pilus assembly protein TadD